MEGAIQFYLRLLSGKMTLRFEYPEAGLELAAVSSAKLSVLIVAGHAEKRAPFEETRLTRKIDQLETHLDHLLLMGATQLESVQKTPVVRKPDFVIQRVLWLSMWNTGLQKSVHLPMINVPS